jgi:hypothetical protein
VCEVFRAITALALLAASSATGIAAAATTTADSDTLLSTAPWWEKVTVTIGGDGKTQACQYESSLKPADSQQCDVSDAGAAKAGASGSKAELTKITFERRFTPGGEPASPKLQTGDTLLGGQVMALAIDARGQVKKCQIVAASGDMKPDYGCAEATAERFDASVGSQHNVAREGYMTILVYGHPEHVV